MKLVASVLLIGAVSAMDALAAQRAQFQQFKATYGRTYATAEEESARFQHFVGNLKLAEMRMSGGNTAVHGVTKFMDLSPHDLDFVRWAIRSEPVEVFASGCSSTAELAEAGSSPPRASLKVSL